MSANPVVSARDFFAALYDGVTVDWIEIRPLLDSQDPRYNDKEARGRAEAEMRRFFEWPKELDACAGYCTKISGSVFHVYFGVVLRKGPRGGGKKDCAAATCVFADIDFKDVTPERVREILAKFPLPPSIVVRSGHGLHVYWLLKKALFESAFPRIEAVNRAVL